MASRLRQQLLVERADLRDAVQLELDREVIDAIDWLRPRTMSRSDFVERVLRNALDDPDPLGLRAYDALAEADRLWARYCRFIATGR